jgi:glycosyltransferase involved in cell wall biosynthesis
VQSSAPKIAYVVNSVNPGGTEKLVVEMSTAYCGEFDIDVVCLDEPGEWARELRARGIPVRALWRQPGLDASMAVELARHCRRRRIDIIHAHQTTPWFYGALSRLIYSRPRLLFEEHGRFFPEVDNPKRRIVNRALIRRLTHRTIAVSDDIKRRLERYEGLDADEIDVVYNGVRPVERLDAARRAALRGALGFAEHEFVVGTVGRFDPIKNLPLLVESVHECRGTDGALRGLLVGDGPEFGRVRAQLESRGLADVVRLTGFRGDARELVQCMDLFVLSSFSEGTSMALLEAMAAGVPVVVTAVGGNVEVVDGGVTGWVVPSASQADMVAAIRAAVADAAKRSDFAAAGERRFNERFALDTMLDRYRQIYRELL